MSIQFANDDKTRLTSASRDGTLSVFDLTSDPPSLACVLRGHTRAVNGKCYIRNPLTDQTASCSESLELIPLLSPLPLPSSPPLLPSSPLLLPSFPPLLLPSQTLIGLWPMTLLYQLPQTVPVDCGTPPRVFACERYRMEATHAPSAVAFIPTTTIFSLYPSLDLLFALKHSVHGDRCLLPP